jgi:uncharacterized protein (TIGR02996 family)
MNGGSLREAIVDCPDEDAVRRVYADWLDDTGEPENAARAELLLDRFADSGTEFARNWLLRIGCWRGRRFPCSICIATFYRA